MAPVKAGDNSLAFLAVAAPGVAEVSPFVVVEVPAMK
jgi:hypothetical protein